jgi:hypothetical protein
MFEAMIIDIKMLDSFLKVPVEFDNWVVLIYNECICCIWDSKRKS